MNSLLNPNNWKFIPCHNGKYITYDLEAQTIQEIETNSTLGEEYSICSYLANLQYFPHYKEIYQELMTVGKQLFNAKPLNRKTYELDNDALVHWYGNMTSNLEIITSLKTFPLTLNPNSIFETPDWNLLKSIIEKTLKLEPTTLKETILLILKNNPQKTYSSEQITRIINNNSEFKVNNQNHANTILNQLFHEQLIAKPKRGIYTSLHFSKSTYKLNLYNKIKPELKDGKAIKDIILNLLNAKPDTAFTVKQITYAICTEHDRATAERMHQILIHLTKRDYIKKLESKPRKFQAK